MATKVFTGTCACCGADITAPQFHEGKAYGYTCITKVAPGTKPSKVKYRALSDNDKVVIQAQKDTTRILVKVVLEDGTVLGGVGYNQVQREYQTGDTFRATLSTLSGTRVNYYFDCVSNGMFLSLKPVKVRTPN